MIHPMSYVQRLAVLSHLLNAPRVVTYRDLVFNGFWHLRSPNAVIDIRRHQEHVAGTPSWWDPRAAWYFPNDLVRSELLEEVRGAGGDYSRWACRPRDVPGEPRTTVDDFLELACKSYHPGARYWFYGAYGEPVPFIKAGSGDLWRFEHEEAQEQIIYGPSAVMRPVWRLETTKQMAHELEREFKKACEPWARLRPDGYRDRLEYFRPEGNTLIISRELQTRFPYKITEGKR